MASVYVLIRFLVFVSFVFSVLGQNKLPSTVSSPQSSSTGLAFASSTSQMAWWEKQWDIVVVGSGPAGIIGNSLLLLFEIALSSPIFCLRFPFVPFSFSFSSLANIHEAASKCASSSANLSVLLLEAGGPSYACVGGIAHPDWLNGANISRVDCPGLYNSIYDTTEPSTQSLLCNRAINAFGGCTVGGSTAINAGLYFVPPDSDWDSWGIQSWSSSSIRQSATALQGVIGAGETITSTDGQLYLQSSYAAMSNWLGRAGYSEVNVNSQGSYNSKTKVRCNPRPF